jgi:hypothetical protein
LHKSFAPAVLPVLPAPVRGRYNRLTSERLLSIMVDVCKIEDGALRRSIIDKLMVGERGGLGNGK